MVDLNTLIFLANVKTSLAKPGDHSNTKSERVTTTRSLSGLPHHEVLLLFVFTLMHFISTTSIYIYIIIVYILHIICILYIQIYIYICFWCK